MSESHEPLCESLRELADTVEPADLYEGALRRSRRIGRREATVGTGAALLALVLLGSGLWRLPHGREAEVPVAAASTAAVSAEGFPADPAPASRSVPAVSRAAERPAPATAHPRKRQPQVVKTTATPRSRSLADLPGHVFYQQAGPAPDVVRLSPAAGRTETVLHDAPSPVGISPDGSRIAYVADGRLLVDDTRAGGTREVADGVATAEQAPTWSPDGDRLLIDTTAPAVLAITDKTITPLPGGLGDGQHFRWSGDGHKLVYATAHCGLEVAASSDQSGTADPVPVLGDPQLVDNPDGLAACKPTSVDATGRRVTVPLQTTGEKDTSAATADAVVDTVTGDLVPLPVSGVVVGAVFDPEGNLLIRTERRGKSRLSLFAADGTLLVQASEPTAVRDLDLIAYTR
jgi:TolB protein